MGFFKDFKQDLSAAVNELTDEAIGVSTPVEEASASEPATMEASDADMSADDVMVDTLETDEDAKLAADLEAMLSGASVSTTDTSAVEDVLDEATAMEASMNASDSDEIEETVSIPTEAIADSIEEKEEETMNEELNTAEEVVMDEVDTMPQEEEVISDETAIITPGLKIKGDIESIGSIELLGTVEGNVTCRGKLVASGTITGNTQSSEFFSDKAKINGDINCDGPAKIGNGSVIKGQLTATSAVIAGAIKGDIDVHGPVIIDNSAIVIGDIKSKSVQINNGAVIDGRVSQCYADLKPVTIFGED